MNRRDTEKFLQMALSHLIEGQRYLGRIQEISGEIPGVLDDIDGVILDTECIRDKWRQGFVDRRKDEVWL